MDLKSFSSKDLINKTCPKTHLNILQYCVLKNSEIKSTVELFRDKNDLFNTIFLKKAGTGSSSLTAFELAVSLGNHEAIEVFNNQNLPQVSILTAKSILQTAISNDRGSTIGYLMATTLKFLKEDLPDDFQDLLQYACDQEAKHSVRFLATSLNFKQEPTTQNE